MHNKVWHEEHRGDWLHTIIFFLQLTLSLKIKTKIWKMNINEVDTNYTRLYRRGHLHSCSLSKDRGIISWITVH